MAGTGSDPRRPSDVHSFVREKIDPATLPPDYYSIISLLFGMVSFSLKWKPFAWASFVFCAISFANLRAADVNTRQLSMSIMFATMSIVSAYALMRERELVEPVAGHVLPSKTRRATHVPTTASGNNNARPQSPTVSTPSALVQLAPLAKMSVEETQQRQMRSFVHNFLANERGDLLREIDLQQHALDTGMAVTDATLQEVVNAVPHARGFKLTGCAAITDAGIWALARQCTQLEAIHLAGCICVTELGLRLLAHNCQRLKTVDLSDCPQLTDTVLQTLAAGCWALETVVLQRCDHVTDAGLVKLAQCCKGLKHLDVSECQHVGEFGDKALVELGKCCPQLRVLDLYGCRHVRDLGVRAVARGCPLLTTLRLTGCRDVSSVAIRALASQCHGLKVLSLAGCVKTNSEDVAQLAKNCQQLERLDISGSPNIDVAGVAALAEHCSQLSYLSLAQCPRLNDAALQALHVLGQRSNSLTSLSLAGCPRITERGVDALTTACSNLVTLDLTNCDGIGRRFLQQLIVKLAFVEWATTFFGFQPLPNAAELCRQRDRRLLENRCAVKIQAAMRGCLARGGLWEARLRFVERHSLPKIQARIRGFLARKRFRAEQQHAREIRAAQLIAHHYRSLQLRRMLARAKRVRWIREHEEAAALIFQKMFRGHRDRQRVQRMRDARYRERQRQARVQAMLELAAIKVQRAYRGHLGRCDVAVRRAAREAQRLQLERETKAARFLQRAYRGHNGRKLRKKRLAELLELRRRHEGATRVQALYRGHRARRNVRVLRAEAGELRRINAAMTIQRHWRGVKDKHLAAVLIGLVKLRAREEDAARRIQVVYRSYASRGLAKALRLTLKAQQQRLKATLTLQRMVRGHLGRSNAEVQRELRKLYVQAKPLFDKEARLEALVDDQRDKVESLARKIAADTDEERALTIELEKTLQIKTKYHDSSRITGTPQRYLTQYLQVQLADQVRAKRVEMALDARTADALAMSYSDAQKQLRLVKRDLEPLTQGVMKNARTKRTKRLQDKVRRERYAATKIQKIFRGFRVRSAVKEGMNCWVELMDAATQRPYYYNTFTGVTRKHRPLAMDIFLDTLVPPMELPVLESEESSNENAGEATEPAATSGRASHWYEGYDEQLGKPYYFNSDSQVTQWVRPSSGGSYHTERETARRRKEWLQDQHGNLAALLAASTLRQTIGEWEERQHALSENVFFFHPTTHAVRASLSPRSAHPSQRDDRTNLMRTARSIRSARSMHWQFRYGYEYDNSGQLVQSHGPRPIWTEHVDPASGMHYYHSQLTDEYRWDKPADFAATYEELEHAPNASREWFKQQKEDDPERVSGRSGRRQRTLGKKWIELVDPETQYTYYYNEITGETRWSLSPRSARDDTDREDEIPLALFAQVKELREHAVPYSARDEHMRWLDEAIEEKNWKKVDAMIQQILLRERSQTVTEREMKPASSGGMTQPVIAEDASDDGDYDIALPSVRSQSSARAASARSVGDVAEQAAVDAVVEESNYELAPGWIPCEDDQGNTYYFYEITGETTWEKPVVKAGSNPSNPASQWQMAYDGDGRPYYYNAGTGESSWIDPTGR
ncbi:TPA: hypothetical protein N0F65_009066 [Lagenidium giganteum]|uniref:WW domain-containing protein n=1 Tax=Lagenidium giganteum TaxID=4803 RepID=A0AAV2YTC8_9STRA|nr:TPA: hypothetical protein N0F65_009066 [Lagenidium giganteum]